MHLNLSTFSQMFCEFIVDEFVYVITHCKKEIKFIHFFHHSGETVVERIMSSWLSLTMYRHLTGNIGSSLLELCLAIKKQAYSGPVDVCTNEARFTLSEGFFLKNYKFEESEILVSFINVRS